VKRIDKFNEDEKIIKPIIKYFKKSKYNITGPLSADTAFLKKNRKNFDVTCRHVSRSSFDTN
jgi:4-hydroxy-L-threonine phosphate dehydrogenase PdxA